MTLCAGICEYKGYGSCSIRLSQPLLKYRTSNQLKQTLIHQMIHAYLFITDPQACKTNGGHGKQFQEIMNNVNNITGLRVTIYHNFNDQVQLYRKHIWRCNGICQERPPYFGYVKRTMNRKPQLADHWFKDHQRYCGGQFIKIGQPQKNVNKQKQEKNRNGKSIQEYIQQMQKKEINYNKKKNQNIQIKKQQKKVSLQKKYKNKQKKQFSVNIMQKKGKTIDQYIKQMQKDAKTKNKQSL